MAVKQSLVTDRKYLTAAAVHRTVFSVVLMSARIREPIRTNNYISSMHLLTCSTILSSHLSLLLGLYRYLRCDMRVIENSLSDLYFVFYFIFGVGGCRQ